MNSSTPLYDATAKAVKFNPASTRIRVWEIAKRMGVTSKDVLADMRGVRSASSKVDISEANAVSERMGGTARWVSTVGGIVEASTEGDTNNNVLRSCTLLALDGLDNPLDAQGSPRTWVVLSVGASPRTYILVNRVTGVRLEVPSDHMTNLW